MRLENVTGRAWFFYVVLAALLAIPAFWNLGGGEIREWDEGLALRHANNALHFDSWLVPTSNSGHFSRAFTKPPLLIWQVAWGLSWFGPSVVGARVGTALALLVTGLVAAALARRMELSRFVAAAWALVIVCAGGGVTWARSVNIEITLVLFSMTALYCYARSHGGVSPEPSARRWAGWAVGAGLAISGAFLTKQLVCALPAISIVLCELCLFRWQQWKRSVVRLALAGGIPSAVAGVWSLVAYQASSGKVVKAMVDFTVVKRVQGFGGGQHYNHLNRVALYLTEAFEPFAWELAALGFVLLWLKAVRWRNPAFLLVTLHLLVAVAVYDSLTRALLPWYAWSVAVPLMLGLAFALGRAAEEALGWCRRALRAEPGQRVWPEAPSAAAVIGASSCALAVSELWHRTGSRLTLFLVLFVAVALCCLLLPRVRRTWLRAGLVGIAVVSPATSCVYALGQRQEYHLDPGPLSALMEPVRASGARRVAVERRLAAHENRYRALFGPQAVPTSAAPWSKKSRGKVEAYVESGQYPAELQPRKGVELFRSAGVVAWVGGLSKPPIADKAIKQLVDKGPLTFEAEHATSDYPATFWTEDGELGRGVQWVNVAAYKPRIGTLASFRTPKLPAGRYAVDVLVAAECDKRRRGSVGNIALRLGTAKRGAPVGCRNDGVTPVTLEASTGTPSELRVQVEFRAGSLWVDKMVVRKLPKPSKKKQPRGKRKKKPKQ